MPKGIPVATFAIGAAGAANAALFAVAMLANDDADAARPARRLSAPRQTEAARGMTPCRNGAPMSGATHRAVFRRAPRWA